MAKPKTPNQKNKYSQLNKRLAKYVALVRNLYDVLNLEAAKMAEMAGYSDKGKPFHFKDYPKLKDGVKKLQNRFVKDLSAIIYTGTSREWKESNLVQDLVADNVLKTFGATVSGGKYKQYYHTNSDALKAFQERRDKGLNLSQKIWNQSQNYKDELEYAISAAIEKGTSAVTLSKQISKYLENFKTLQKDYKEKYGKAVVCHDCHYKSIRLARSEINLAYRAAEQKRWEQMDFVVGQEIKLSNNHTCNGVPFTDICDDLAGKYPKDFKFTGWHPMCRCYVIPILKTEDEFWSDEENGSVNEIKDTPKQFKDWISRNKGRIKESKAKGTLPYFVKDNLSYIKNLHTKPNHIFESASKINDIQYTGFDKNLILKSKTSLEKYQEANVYLSNLYGKGFAGSNIYKKMMAELNQGKGFDAAVNVFLNEAKDNMLGEVLSSTKKISIIEKTAIDSIYKPWQNKFIEYIRKINSHDITSKGYFDVYRDIEGAYNILMLSNDKKLVEYGLHKISSNTPYSLIEKLRSLGLDSAEYLADKEFYDLFDTFIPAYISNGGASHYSPVYNNVKFVFDKRMINSKVAIMYSQYHEYTHALEDLNGKWRNNAEWTSLFRKYADEFNNDVLTFGSNKYYGHTFKTEYQKAYNKMFKSYNNDEYAIALSDLYVAFDKNHMDFGQGCHRKDYFANNEMCVAEFIAHASEIYWYGNPFIEKLMPNLYEEMKELFSVSLKRIAK